MDKKNTLRRWLWYFSIPAAAILLFKVSDNLGQAVGLIGSLIGILSPFVGGLILAFFLHVPSMWLETQIKRLHGKAWQKLARPISLLVVYLALLGLLTLLVAAIIPLLETSLRDLVAAAPGYIEGAIQELERLTQPDGLLGQFGIRINLQELQQKLLGAAAKLVTTDNLMTALRGVGSVASSLLDVIIAIVVSVYMLIGREYLLREARTVCSLFVKPQHLGQLGRFSHKVARIFYSYFYSALLDALLVGVFVTIALLIFGVPYAALLGMGMGLMNMIPYFGAIIGGVVVAIVTLLTTNFYTAIAVTITIIVLQQIDANIIQPRIIGETVGLRPIYVLLSITLFGGIFGFWGIFLAVPLMAVIQLLVKAAIRRKNAYQEKYRPDAPEK